MQSNPVGNEVADNATYQSVGLGRQLDREKNSII